MQNNVDIDIFGAVVYRRLLPNVTEFCTEMNRVIRILQAYKDSEMVVIGYYNAYLSVQKKKKNLSVQKKKPKPIISQVINANTTRGFDLLDAAYLHLRPKPKFMSDVNIS